MIAHVLLNLLNEENRLKCEACREMRAAKSQTSLARAFAAC